MIHRAAVSKTATASIAVVALVIVAATIVIVESSSSVGIDPGEPGYQEPNTCTTCSTSTTPIFVNSTTNSANKIAVTGLSLCPSNCIYPAPYVSALVTINASVPISTLQVYVNNTYDGMPIQNPSVTTVVCTTSVGPTCSVELGGTAYSNAIYASSTRFYATCSVLANETSCSATSTGSLNNMTEYAYQYKGSLPDRDIPVTSGVRYIFTFIATFQDGSVTSEAVSLVAA
jgi:hypothetical protein